MLKKVLFAAAVAMLTSASVANAGVLLSDNFNAENGGTGALNYTGFTNWTAPSPGSVDLIGNGFFDFYPGNGLYVDLDGSTGGQNPAGQLVSKATFGPGTYTLTFDLGGSQRGDTNTVEVSLGSFVQDITLPSSSPLALQSFTFTTGSGGPLSFVELGNSDNVGLILDNVTLGTVPEPMTLSLFATGLVGAAAMRRRRRKTV